jgi:energy-coupling factor transport system ATP-binding protein
VESGPPADLLAHSPVAPPVVELGRMLGWSPLPLSVRDARRAAGSLREQLEGRRPTPRPKPARSPEPAARLRGIVSSYGDVLALRGVDLDLHRGEIVALMGRNGAGKSTLLSVLAGLLTPKAGVVSMDGAGTSDRRRLGLVPHEPTDLLWAQSVSAECSEADKGAGVQPGTTRDILATLTADVDDDLHPRDLSEGQRLALALAVVLVADPAVIALDEPTRGLDYPAKQQLAANLRRLADAGHCIVLATHDVELVAELVDRIVVLADGEVVADGPAAEVVVASPIFAPQVSKVLAPLPWLTVRSVEEALAG